MRMGQTMVGLAGLLVMLLAMPVTQVSAVTEPASAELPDSALGAFGKEFIHCLDAPDGPAIHAFVESRLATTLTQQRPAAEWTAMLTGVARDSGGVTLQSVIPGSPPGVLRMLLHARKVDRSFGVEMRTSEAQPGVLELLEFHPMPRQMPGPWPPAARGEAGVVQELAQRAERAAAHDDFSGVILLAKGDQVLLQRAYGLARVHPQQTNQIDTSFRLASMGKMFTAVAIAQLVEAGKLSFDDSLAKLLPDYPDREAARKITVAQLMSHRSGLGDIFTPELAAHRERYVRPADYFPLFANQRLAFEPGTGWSYSNAGFVVLGAIVEKVSGQSYFDYVREHIFVPAGMLDTSFPVVGEYGPRGSIGYTSAPDDPAGLRARVSNESKLPYRGSPAGGCDSTAPDLLRFARALVSGKLISRKLVETLTSPQSHGPGGRPYGYGFEVGGMAGHEYAGHTGGAEGMSTSLTFFLDGSYTLVVLSNYDPPIAQLLAAGAVQALTP